MAGLSNRGVSPRGHVLLGVLVLALLSSACASGPFRDKPRIPPTYHIETLGAGRYRFEGRILAREALREELLFIADQHRNEITGESRMRLRILSNGGYNDPEAMAVRNDAAGIGINSVRVEVR